MSEPGVLRTIPCTERELGDRVLRKTDKASVSYARKWRWSKVGWTQFYDGKNLHRLGDTTAEAFVAAEALQEHQVCFVHRVGDRNYWRFQDGFYWDDENLTPGQVQALLVTRAQRRGAQIERAEQIVAMGPSRRPLAQRGTIPDDVKHLVWTRDGGACRTCESGVELQFDHVIPIAMGGASTPENLQILCGPCNRRKGARVTG